MDGFADFEFNLPRALRVDLVELLERTPPAPLEPQITAQLPEEQGVYQLFHDDRLVYIGKTDAEAGLRTRLARHSKKVLHRPTLTGAVRFKAVRVMVFAAMDLETQLLKHYRATNAKAVPWNGSGFGSNDPGRKREETTQKPDGFDAQHPISIDLPGDFMAPGPTTVAQALVALKARLPYTFRFQTRLNAQGRPQRGKPHADLVNTSVTIPPGPHTVRDLLVLFRTALGSEWQATAFTNQVILYKEEKTYEFGEVI